MATRLLATSPRHIPPESVILPVLSSAVRNLKTVLRAASDEACDPVTTIKSSTNVNNDNRIKPSTLGTSNNLPSQSSHLIKNVNGGIQSSDKCTDTNNGSSDTTENKENINPDSKDSPLLTMLSEEFYHNLSEALDTDAVTANNSVPKCSSTKQDAQTANGTQAVSTVPPVSNILHGLMSQVSIYIVIQLFVEQYV